MYDTLMPTPSGSVVSFFVEQQATINIIASHLELSDAVFIRFGFDRDLVVKNSTEFSIHKIEDLPISLGDPDVQATHKLHTS